MNSLKLLSSVTRNTSKSFSEALILASVYTQYDKRLLIEFPEKYKFTKYMLCTIIDFLFLF